jgi:hypothetical protein
MLILYNESLAESITRLSREGFRIPIYQITQARFAPANWASLFKCRRGALTLDIQLIPGKEIRLQ